MLKTFFLAQIIALIDIRIELKFILKNDFIGNCEFV